MGAARIDAHSCVLNGRCMEQQSPGHSMAWGVLRPTVVIVGSGIWSEVLARLVFRAGGSAITVDRPDGLIADPVALRPAAIIVGSPLLPSELVRIAVMVRDRAPGTLVIAALDEKAPADLADDLRTVGAAAIPIEEDLRQLSEWVARAAGLHIRDAHRGILLAPVLMRSGHVLHAAIASDISEGGLGIEGADPTLIGDVAEAQFHLPGMHAPITVATEVAWVGEAIGSRVRAGIRFKDLDPLDRAAIRAYQDEPAYPTTDDSVIALPH